MNLYFQKLSEEHLPMVNAFSCIESQEYLKKYNAKERRRILKHSQEMDFFLKTEAFKEQEEGLNTTHLFIEAEENKIAAYISLCNDSIRLDFSESNKMGYSYTTIPALKIARLAVSTNYQHLGIGKLLIQFSIHIGIQLKKLSGTAFVTLDCFKHRLSFYKSVGFVENLIQPIILPYDSPISMRLNIKEYLSQMASKG